MFQYGIRSKIKGDLLEINNSKYDSQSALALIKGADAPVVDQNPINTNHVSEAPLQRRNIIRKRPLENHSVASPNKVRKGSKKIDEFFPALTLSQSQDIDQEI